MEHKKKKNESHRPRFDRTIKMGIILGIVLIFSCVLLINAYGRKLETDRAMRSTIIDMTQTKEMFDLETDMTSTQAAQMVETNILRTQQATITSTALP